MSLGNGLIELGWQAEKVFQPFNASVFFSFIILVDFQFALSVIIDKDLLKSSLSFSLSFFVS